MFRCVARLHGPIIQLQGKIRNGAECFGGNCIAKHPVRHAVEDALITSVKAIGVKEKGGSPLTFIFFNLILNEFDARHM